MKIFSDLATEIEQAWLNEKNNLVAFTALSTQALTNFNCNWSLEKLDEELRNWLLENPKLPQQMSLHNTFGQPSITLFNNNQFVVDLYFWVDFDTSIHSHGFRGAFRLLHGESLQETFQIKTVDKVADDIQIVDLSLVNLKRLRKHDVQTIAPGADLTHRVIHLANPTVTLCVKTINEPELRQCNYFASGLALQRQTLSVELAKRIYFYQYLLSHNPISAQSFLQTILGELNISTQILVYESVASGALDLSEDTVGHIAGAVIELHKNSQWWPIYEKALVSAMEELPLKDRQKPLERLVGHFYNCGYDLADIQKLDPAPMAELEPILAELKKSFT